MKAFWRRSDDGRRLLYPALAVALLALCVALHVYRLGQAPGWDPQEGYNLDIAWNLAHGRLRLFALTSDFAQHPPLFYLQLALAIRLLGYNILAIRALAAVYAVLTCAALLTVGRRLVGDAATLWGALVFCVAPVFLANTRWGYSYAQLAFVGVLCLGATERAVTRYRQGDATRGWRWLLAAAALAGLAAFSDYEGIAWVAFVALVALTLRQPDEPPGQRDRWRARLRRTLIPLGVGLSVPIVGLLICWLLAPGLFVADLGETLGRVASGGPLIGLLSLLLNYYRLVTFDPWVTLGLVGLLFVPQRLMGRGLLPGAVALVALVALATRPIGLSFHTATPLLPLLALGAGLALAAAARILRHTTLAWARDLAPHAAPMRSVEDDAPKPLAAPRPPSPPRDPPPQGEGRERGADSTTHANPSPPSVPLSRRSGGGTGATPQGQAWVGATLARLAAALVIFVVVASPLALAAASDLAGLSTTFPTRQDAILGTASDAQAVQRYIYAHARAGDLTLASPEVAWMFDRPDGPAPQIEGADILQTLAQAGQATAFYPAGLPASRWAYPVALARARYVVVDNLLRQLAAPDQLPTLIPLLTRVERWPVVFTSGQYIVYAQPPGGA